MELAHARPGEPLRPKLILKGSVGPFIDPETTDPAGMKSIQARDCFRLDFFSGHFRTGIRLRSLLYGLYLRGFFSGFLLALD